MNSDHHKQLHVEETDDSCRREFTDIVPLTRDTDGSCTTELCVSEDWSAEVKQEDLSVVKQEPDNVCCVICAIFSLSQPVLDGTQCNALHTCAMSH